LAETAAGNRLRPSHDHSNFLEKQREFWESVFSPANPAAVVGQDRRTIEYPLPVKELRSADSRHFPQLQIADLIASAARAYANGLVARSKDPFLDALRDAGLMNALAGGVWPSASVLPEELETEGPVLGDAASLSLGSLSRVGTDRAQSPPKTLASKIPCETEIRVQLRPKLRVLGGVFEVGSQ
jgi:hypothetical protein